METVTSRIKTMFQPELLRYIAAVCDTRRIESNNEKMIVLCDLLYTNGINFEILGGATNRIALQIEGYAVKFAMDEQGYLDNLIEYSLSPELQPFVTKSYETNGYIQVQELVEVMTKELFRVHKTGIYKILNSLCQDYLLGDVGYLDKNRTNWGTRDGQPVILDYAYCHRATENLFTCSKCGAPLTYDSTYDKLMCTDRSGCKTIYTYNERKRVQGKKVDEDMVKERKAESIKLSGTDVSKEIEMFEDRIVGDNYFIIDCPGDMYNYNKLKEALTMQISINGDDNNMIGLEERFAAMVDLAKNPGDMKAKEIVEASSTDEIPEPIYTDNYQEKYMYGSGVGIRRYDTNMIATEDEVDECEDETNDDENFDAEDALSALIDKINNDKAAVEEDFNKRSTEQVDSYISEYNKRNNASTSIKEEIPEEPKESDTDEPETADEAVASALTTIGLLTIGKEEESKEDESNSEEEELKQLHESKTKNDDTEESNLWDEKLEVLSSEEETTEEEDDINPEDAAVLVNGKPLPIGKEVRV